MKREVDFGIAWEWVFDQDFISLLAWKSSRRGLSTCVVSPANLAEISRAVLAGELTFRVFFDRASDTNSEFLPLAQGLMNGRTCYVNYPPYVERAINKATMHLDFITHGINVPYTIILPTFEKGGPTEEILKLENVGIPFIVKPAHGGGGVGVLLGATTLAEIIEQRKDYQHDQILIQENIVPRTMEGKRAWFRAYYIGGAVTVCWWDPLAHVYEKLTGEETARHGLQEIERIARIIHGIAKLHFFSTEIAVTEQMKFVSVDYVNDQCDMRIKSKTPDGVPDEVVEYVCDSLSAFAERKVRGDL